MVWQWDGNVESPTITPSIDCVDCKRHFVVTNGVASGQLEALLSPPAHKEKT